MSREVSRANLVGTLTIGSLSLPCAVLEDGTRVLSQRGLLSALGIKHGGALSASRQSNDGGANLPMFVAQRALRPFIDNDLLVVLSQPIKYHHGKGGGLAFGMRAELIPKVCDVWLRAREAGALTPSQQQVAARAEILVRGLSTVGIIALVDEATGYQYFRARTALATILEQFIAKELVKWAKTFPDDYYQELFRLRNWNYSSFSTKRPPVAGKLTNDIVYRRLAPTVLDELRRLNPTLPSGRRKHKHFQWLTADIGHPRLREHLSAVIALMKVAPDWPTFEKMIDKSLPRQLSMPLFTQRYGPGPIPTI